MNGREGLNSLIDSNAKLQAEKAYYATMQAQCGEQSRPTTLREEAQRSAQEHAARSQKDLAAAAFFEAHPEFEEFIQLIRAGAIYI